MSDIERATILIREISAALGSRLLAIEHIGSTAVPQLAAKPIIDLNGMLDSFADIDASIPILTEMDIAHVISTFYRRTAIIGTSTLFFGTHSEEIRSGARAMPL